MRIEFGFQANCSELVAYLGWMTTEEIVTGMRRIHEITGWTWRLNVALEKIEESRRIIERSYQILVPVENLDDLYASVNTNGSKIFGIIPSDLVRKWEDLLPDEVVAELMQMSRDLPGHPGDNLHQPTLKNIPESDPIHLITESDEGAELDLLFHQGEEYFEDGMYLDVWDKDIVSFPIFHKVRTALGADHVDGTARYNMWMQYHYLLPDGWELGLSDHEREELIARTPPLPDSKGPDEYDTLVIMHDVDLFSPIGSIDGKEILQTIEMMVEVTGLSWWYSDTGLGYSLGIPPTILRSMFNPRNGKAKEELEEDEKDWSGFDPLPLFDHWMEWKGPDEEERKKLKYRNYPTEEGIRAVIGELKERMASRTYYEHTYLLLTQSRLDDVSCLMWGAIEPVARIAYNEETDTYDLMLCIYSYSTDHMPAFHRLRKEFHGKLERKECGRLDRYVDWMAFHLHNDGRLRKEWRKETVKLLSEYPPLPGPCELDEEDKKLIEKRFRDIAGKTTKEEVSKEEKEGEEAGEVERR